MRLAVFCIIVLALGAGDTNPAEAGTPYWCVCKGTKTRFIGATRGCELDRERAAGNPVVRGLFKLRGCTSSEFDAWRAKACNQNGCKPVRF